MKYRLFTAVVLLAVAAPVFAQDIPLAKILVAKDAWREIATSWPGVTYLDAQPSGDVAIYQVQLSGNIAPDGKTKILKVPELSIERDHKSALGFGITLDGKSVARFLKGNREPLKLKGVTAPSCLTAWPDQGHLVIGEADGAYLWAFRIEKDGSLGPGDRYYSLRTVPNQKMHVAAMTMDANYLLYACTPLGVQVFDPTGRLSGVIPGPTKERMTAIAIGGAKADELYIAAGDKIYARRIQGKASYTLKK